MGATTCWTLALTSVLAATASAGPGQAPPSLPLAFEARGGGADPAFPFLARGEGFAVRVGGGGAAWTSARGGAALRLLGARSGAVPSAGKALPGRILDLTGSRPVARLAFGGLSVEGIYPGVDLAWRTEGGDLGYDLSFAPGTDPASAVLEMDGARDLSVGAGGDLRVCLPGGVLCHSAPVAWQEDGGLRRAVASAFEPLGGGRFRFRVEGRDPRLPLVIDPVVRFVAYLGGSGEDRARAVAVDGAGAVFVAGVTASPDFPASGGPGSAFSGGTDAFLAKLAPDGTVIFTAFLGGSGDDQALAVAVDDGGSAWVCGVTSSSDFPLRSPLVGAPGGATDGFVTRFSPDGASLLLSTYLGGGGDDRAAALAIGIGGDAWVAGTTDSHDFPVTGDAIQGIPAGDADAFLVRIAADGSEVLFGSFFGGPGRDEAFALATDALGGVTVVGATDSGDFIVWGGPQSVLGGSRDGFAFRIDGVGALAFSTYIGGSGDDAALAVSASADGTLAVAGVTRSSDFPVSDALQDSLAGGSDGFVLTLPLDGFRIFSSTYLGGSGDDEVRAVGFTTGGGIVAGGSTRSTDFPVRAAGQPAAGGGSDGFLVRLSPDAGSLDYGTYLGGSGDESVDALVVEGSTAAVVAGVRTTASGTDAFVGRALLQTAPPSGLSVAALTHRSITLAWTDPAGGRSSFEVQRRDPGADWAGMGALAAGSAAWTDPAVLPASSYDYRLRAILDGVPSEYTAPLAAGTLSTPPPTAPGALVLEVLSPTAISLGWEDRSGDEIEFQLFRGADGAVPVLVKSLPAGSTAWTDGGLAADRLYTYTVRAVGAPGPSAPSAPASAATPATWGLAYLAGRRVDAARFSGDSLDLTLALSWLGSGSRPDFRATGLSLGIGDAGAPALLSIPAGASGWSEPKGVLTWRSPRGSLVKAVLVVDPVKGTLRFRASHMEMGPLDPGAVRAWVRGGLDGGSVTAPWRARKAGLLTF